MAEQSFYVHRRQAVRVGGQRQRNRLSRVPRSHTTPILNPSGAVTGASSDVVRDLGAEEGAYAARQPEGMSSLNTSQSMMNFRDLPPYGVPVELRSLSQDSTRAPGSASPASTAGSASSAAVDGNKANSFPFRSSSRLPPPPPLETSPLPPVTPTKAAKLLGIAPKRGERTGSPLAVQHDGVFEYDTVIRETPHSRDQYGWEERFLGAYAGATASSETLAGRAQETDIEPNPPKTKGFWNKMTAKNMPGSNQPTYPVQSPPPGCSRALPPLPPRRRKSKSKRKHGKDKFVDMMAPITETSRDDTSSFRSVSENTQPGAMSEDTPTDESAAEKEKTMVHGKPMELSRAKTRLPVRSPLQALEADCLDAAEVAHMQKVKQDHEQMKREFAALQCSNWGHGVARKKDDDAVSISSSIDLDEEPTLHNAVPMTVRRVRPGEVRVVDIPPRRKRQG